MTAKQFISTANKAAITEYTAENKHNMFTFNHPQTEQTPALTDYRFIGNDPYNYVYFNCDSLDNQSEDTCEIWRILGVFSVDDGTGNYEPRIKLVRGSALVEQMAWDDRASEDGINNFGINNWDDSVVNTFLSGDYLNRTGVASTFGLKSNSVNMIDDVIYYLGGIENYDNNIQYGSTEYIYSWERSMNKYNRNGAVRSLNWKGKVALMYPSDMYMTYANGVNNICFNSPYKCYYEYSGVPSTGWIFNSNTLENSLSLSDVWLLSPSAGSGFHSFYSYYNEGFGTQLCNKISGIRPVVYLKSSIKITGGTGQENDPYVLSY